MKLKRTPAPPSVLKPQVNSSVDISRYSSTLLEIPCTLVLLSGYLVVRMQKLDYTPPPPPPVFEGLKPAVERLEVASQRQQQEMDFSRICENNDLPPDLEPID